MGYEMQVDFFGNSVRANTEGLVLCLNDLFLAGNAWRLNHGKAVMQLATFINAKGTDEYLLAAAKEWGVPVASLLYKVGKGKYTRTMCHISIALLAAEQMSPEFHAKAHRVLVEGKLLEFRNYGGTEFKVLNVAIDSYLPDSSEKNNVGIFINTAKLLRKKILGLEEAKGWDSASLDQTHQRYEIEKSLSQMLKLGVVRDWEHLKEVIEKM